MVGCGKIVCISSSSVVSRFIATHVALDQLGDLGPTIWAPMSAPLFLSKITFTSPWSSPKRDRFAVADKRKAPDADVDLHFLRLRLGQSD